VLPLAQAEQVEHRKQLTALTEMLELMAEILCLESSALGAETEVEPGQQPLDLLEWAEQDNLLVELVELVADHQLQATLLALH
jgi:hypothetical protein